MQSKSVQWLEVKQACETALNPDIVAFIENAKQDAEPASQLIAVLHKVQDTYGYLAPEHMDAVAQLLGVPAAMVSGVATFYHFFQLSKPGKFRISVCMGTACYVKGADKILARLQDELGIDIGETTRDGLFSLLQCRCLGTCGLAPVITVNDKVIERVTPDKIPSLLEHLTQQAKQA